MGASRHARVPKPDQGLHTVIIRIDGDGSVYLREATDLRRFSISMPATESST